MESIPNDTIKKIYSEFLSFFKRGRFDISQSGPITPLGFPKSGHPAYAILMGEREGEGVKGERERKRGQLFFRSYPPVIVCHYYTHGLPHTHTDTHTHFYIS